jgi:hypothetical protein
MRFLYVNRKTLLSAFVVKFFAFFPFRPGAPYAARNIRTIPPGGKRLQYQASANAKTQRIPFRPANPRRASR